MSLHRAPTRKGRHRLWASLASAAAAILPLGFLMVAPPASAAASWPVSVDGSVSLAGAPDGSVIANATSNAVTGNELLALHPDGTGSWNVPAAADRSIGEDKQSTDRNGVLYYSLSEGGAYYLVANDHGQERWRKPIGATSHLVAVGSNGQVYDLAYGSGASTLTGYDAATGASLFTPLSLDSATYGAFVRLLPYNGGLVAQSGAQAVYVGLAGGIIGGPYSLSHDGVTETYHDVAISATGELFTSTHSNGPIVGCDPSTQNRDIVKVTPSGLAWRIPRPQVPSGSCLQYGSGIVALPDGTAVFGATSSDGSPSVRQLTSNGLPGWSHDLNVPGAFTGSPGVPVATSDGQTLVPMGYTYDCSGNPCRGTAINRFSSAGASLAPVLVGGSTNGQTEAWSVLDMVPTPGQLIVEASRTASSLTSYQLQAASIADLGAAYPQSVLWQQMPGGSGGGTPSPTPTPTPSPTVSPTPTADCPTLEVFGVRGSRGSTADTADSDNVLDTFVKKLRTKVPTAGFEAIKYPAIPVGYGGIKDYGTNYVDSMFDGVHAFDKALVPFLEHCKTSYVAVVAYSQGTDAAETELETFYSLHPKLAKRILAVVTFGDPRFNPRQPKVDDGDYNRKRHGIWGELPGAELRVIPAGAVGKTKSYCMEGDPVCNYKASDLAICKAQKLGCTHLKYVSRGWVDLGAIWTIGKWRNRAVL